MTLQDPALLTVLAVLAGMLGLVVGSFVNVVIWRVPRGESVVRPPSACPACGDPIRPRDNIPVLSWLLLKGRCRDCGERISIRYPLVEALTGILFILVLLRFGTVAGGTEAAGLAGLWMLPAYLYLCAITIALAAIDLDTQKLPNVIVLPSIVVAGVLLAVASAGSGDWEALVRAAIGSAALFSFYLALALIYPSGMGFGDVKLAAVLGMYLAWLGWGAFLVGAFSAFLLGGVFSIGLLLARKAGSKTAIPFGPWMLLGAGIGIFFGHGIAVGYLAMTGLS